MKGTLRRPFFVCAHQGSMERDDNSRKLTENHEPTRTREVMAISLALATSHAFLLATPHSPKII